MRMRLIVATAVLLFLPLAVHANCKSLSGIVEAYLKDRHPNPPRPLRIAVYNTADRSWHAFRWDGTTFEETKKAIDVPFSNDPTLFVRRSEDPAVLIAHANPLLYSTEVTSMARADIEGLAELQAFFALFGTTVPVIASRTARVPLPQLAPTDSSTVRLFSRSMRAEGGEWKATPKETTDEINQSRRELETIVTEFINALKEHHDRLTTGLDTYGPPIDTAGKRVLAIDARRDDLVERLQKAELGTHSPLTSQEVGELMKLRSTTLTTFDAANTAAKDLAKVEVVCTDSLQALDDALRLVLDGTPDDPNEADEVRTSFRSAIRKLRAAALEEGCPSTGADGATTKRLHDALGALANWLRDAEHRAAAAADDFVGDQLADARDASSAYLEAAGKHEGALAAAKKVQDKRAATLKLAAQLQQFGELYTAEDIDQTDCWMTHGIVEVDRIQNGPFALPWFKVQTEEFAMTVRPMFAEDVVRELPDEVKGKYTFSRGNFGIGVDTALIYTPANDREYKASTRPFDVDNDGTIEDDETAIFVTESSRTERTGKLALMLTVSPKWAHGFGAQFGLGTDTDNPAGFIGLTRSLGRFARISFGHTQQRVTRLGVDQNLGEQLESADDLRTRERFDASWYAALAFTISELPIFKND